RETMSDYNRERSTSLERLLAKLKNVRRSGPNGWKASCPAHDDPEPSLQVTMADATGRLLVHCHGGCSTEPVLGALDLGWADLFEGEVKPSRPRGKKLVSPETVLFRDKVYRHWLAGLPLYDDHKRHLLARGLSADAIEFYGYRSLSPVPVRRSNRSVF